MVHWYKHCLQNGKVSEETYKREAVTFFNLSPEDSIKSKQIFKKEIENFVAMHKNMKKTLLRKFLEENEGTGINYEIPPKNFWRLQMKKNEGKCFQRLSMRKCYRQKNTSPGWVKTAASCLLHVASYQEKNLLRKKILLKDQTTKSS